MSRSIRVTLIHEIEGTKVISNPGGWADAVYGWERSQFSSLIEFYKSSHSLYGSNGSEDGGRDWAKNIEKLYGPDSLIQSLIEISEEDKPWETLFTGQIPIVQAIEALSFDHVMQMVFDPIGFWITFKNRLDTPVQLFSSTNLDGGATTPLTPFDINLPSQKIRKKFAAVQTFGLRIGGDYSIPFNLFPFGCAAWPAGSYNNSQFIQLEPDLITLDEVTKPFPQYTAVVDSRPAPRWVVDYGGSYVFDLFVGMSYYRPLFPTPDWQNTSAKITWVLQVNDLEPIPFTTNDFINGSNEEWTVYDLDTTLNLNPHDVIRIYGKINENQLDALDYLIIWGNDGLSDCAGGHFFDALTGPAHFNMYADTVFPDSQVSSLLIHDIASSIVERTTGVNNSFYSPFLGRTNTLSKTYPENGCGSPYISVKGLQVRGYNLTEKPPSMSMKDFWECWNPILNLGMGYKVIDDVPTIVIDKKENFYDRDNVSVRLSNVRKIKKSYNESLIYKRAEFGYSAGQNEIVSGLDDPQTKRNWASVLKNIGSVLTMFSNGIAASLTIEETRRTTKELSADYKYDNNDLIIKVVEDGLTFKPETTEGYNSVTGLLNWETRYNKDMTPTRNLIRWLNVVCIGLQNSLGSFLKFVSGEGNYDAVINKDDGCLGDYSNVDLSEKQDIQVTDNIIHLPILYDIEHYMTYEQIKAIKANPEYSIEISQTEDNYIKFFIENLSWKQFDGTLKLSAYPIEFFDIQHTDDGNHDYENPNPPKGRIFDRSFNKPFN